MRRQFIITGIILAFLLSNTVVAQVNTVKEQQRGWYLPTHIKMQYAGNIGLVSFGPGYKWAKQVIQTDFLYGYVPHHKGDATIHTFTIKNTFQLYTFYFFDKFNLKPNLGFSISFEPGENSYMRVPSRYPEGYYGPNCFYACLNLGVYSHFNIDKESRFSGFDVYIEANTLADYVFYNILAQEDKNNNIFSLALGVNICFGP